MIKATSILIQSLIVERNALTVLAHHVLVHLVDLVREAAEAAGNRVIFDKFEGARWLVNHVVRAQHQTVNVLHWLAPLPLLVEGPAHVQEAQHEFVVLSEAVEHVVNVLSGARDDAAHQLSHCALIRKSLLVHVDWIGCRK